MKKRTKIILIVVAVTVVIFLLIPTGDSSSSSDVSTQSSVEEKKEASEKNEAQSDTTAEATSETTEVEETAVDYSFIEGESNIFECYEADTEEDVFMDLNWENSDYQKVQYVVYNQGEEFEKGCAVNSPSDINMYEAEDGTKLIYEGKDRYTLVSDTINDTFTLSIDDDYLTDDDMVYLTTNQEVLDFFGNSANVGKKFNCIFDVYGYDDYPTLNISYYVLTFTTSKGQSFMVDMYGYEGNRIFDNSKISVTGIFKSDNSQNADFDITAIMVEEMDN